MSKLKRHINKFRKISFIGEFPKYHYIYTFFSAVNIIYLFVCFYDVRAPLDFFVLFLFFYSIFLVTVNKTKRQSIELQKIFANDTTKG